MKWVDRIAELVGGLIGIGIVMFMPLSLVFSLNTLFDLGLDYTVKTWVAAFILLMLMWSIGMVRPRDRKRRKNDQGG